MTPNTKPNQTQTDPFDPARARALQAALGENPSVDSGDPLPPFFHQIYFWDAQPRSALGRDGHPQTGGFLPDMGLPKRMWAAGRLMFHRPLLAGVRAERTTSVDAVTRKSGRSGPLAFVTLRHDIKQRHTLAVSEYQDIVYREDDGDQTPEPPKAPTGETESKDVTFDTTLLFRYSALTFNGHRIHYDETYAREIEGYNGLVVHGPLLAHLLMQLCDEQLGGLTEFRYRATAPLMHHEPATLCWRDGTAWVRGPDNRQCMVASAR